MRFSLPESTYVPKRSFGGATVSALLHSLAIGGVVLTTASVAETRSRPEDVTPPPIYMRPKEPVRPEHKPTQSTQAIPTNIAPVAPPVTPVNLVVVPSELPDINSTIGTVSAEAFSTLTMDTVTSTVGQVSNEPYTELLVEQPVRAMAGNPAPRFPSMLAQAGVEGSVLMQFVVDTAGRVEPASLHVIKSDHQLFERAVRESLLRARFQPAQVSSRAVRQRVEQAFTFALARR